MPALAAPLRLAMWSGPRNISTALMRSWGNRADTFVVDEPFYAYYLQATGADHPMASEIIAAGETDSGKIIAQLTGDPPHRARIFYQKQMTHHLLPALDRGWLGAVTNCFLIRDPREVIASYLKKNHEPTADDLGFPQQAAIFETVCAETGKTPPVIDARDVLENPERSLRLLCAAVGAEFSTAMLAWPPGPRPTDGIWARHWYGEVERTTGFHSPEPKEISIPARLYAVVEQCEKIYRHLHGYRLK
ncbi:MAG: HAD family hydrolase [Chthoniobacterales bacterium]